MPPRNAPSSTVVLIFVQLFAQLNTSSTSAFQLLAGFFISSSAFPFPSSISGYLSHVARIQFTTLFHQITTSTILTLLAFLQLKYQGIDDQTKSPFATHPGAMRVSVASSVVYFLACAAVLRFPIRCFDHLLVSSGSIAVASLLSVMLPDWAAAFLYAIFGLLAAAAFVLWLLREPEENEEEYFWIRRWRFRRNNIFGNEGNSSDLWMRMRLQV